MKTACSMGPKPGKTAVKASNARISAPTVERLPKLCNKVHLDIQSRYPSEVPVEDCTIFTIPGVLTAAECQLLLGYVQGSHPLERVAHAQTKSLAWRNVDRVEFRSFALSELVWSSGLGSAVCSSVSLPPGMEWAGLNPKWRVYRYTEGQGFGPHYDEEDSDPATKTTSHYTLLLYLSEVSAGGETVFYANKGSMRARHEALAVRPAAGLVLLHAQGARCLLHEGRPVGRGGEKWVLRSDVMVRAAVAACNDAGAAVWSA